MNLIFLVLLPSIYAGVGVTSPGYIIQIAPGQSERFQFEIQTVTLKSTVICDIIFVANPFEVKLDVPSPVTIDPGLRYQVFGTITAPQSMDAGIYKKHYSVSCSSPKVQEVGTSIKEIHGFIPLDLEIVNERTKENPYIPPVEEEPQINYTWLIVLILIIILVLLLTRKRKKKEVKRRS